LAAGRSPGDPQATIPLQSNQPPAANSGSLAWTPSPANTDVISMLEKPDLPDEIIMACLQAEYALKVVQVNFLPVGWQYTAVYRAVAADHAPYFVKLIRGVFDEGAVTVPKFLNDHGIAHIIAPLATKTGQLWASLDDFKLILYPFVQGHNGFQVELSDSQLVNFGRAVKGIHTAIIPPALLRSIQQETYSPKWRASVKTFLERVELDASGDSIAAESASFLKARRGEILDLVTRTGRLAEALQARSPAFVLCHSDLHAGNLLIDAGGAFYIVDWDNPVLAPKERDLMFIGGGFMGGGHNAQKEEALFYRGYGQTQIDSIALAYYRYARIIEDIAVDCEIIFLTNQSEADRAKALKSLKSNFLPNNVLEIAYQSDKNVMPELTSQ
jgi:spectinomycin phosphotransferase